MRYSPDTIDVSCRTGGNDRAVTGGWDRGCTDANSQHAQIHAPTQRRAVRECVSHDYGAVRMCACQGTEQGHVQRDVTANPIPGDNGSLPGMKSRRTGNQMDIAERLTCLATHRHVQACTGLYRPVADWDPPHSALNNIIDAATPTDCRVAQCWARGNPPSNTARV
jgi:hypothetical protein